MPLDPNILLQAQPVKLDNPLDNYARIQQVRGFQNQNRLAEYGLQRAQREDQQQQGLSNAYRDSYDSATGKLDPNKVSGSLAASGNGAAIPAALKSFADMTKSQAEAQKATLEGHSQTLGLIGQVMGGVKDQASYDQSVAYLRSHIPDGGKDLPAVYDPSIVQQTIMKALTAKDQVAKMQKDLDYALDVRKVDETGRHNQATERNAAGQLVVAQGSLGVSKQRLAFDQSQPKGVYDKDNGIIVDTRTGQSRPVIGPDGNPIQPAGKAPTEFQGKSATFGARAEQADKILTQLENSGVKNGGLIKQTASSLPLIGGPAGSIVNSLPSALGGPNPQQQQVEQARRDFVNAVLRQESGAAISQDEFDNAEKQYFPQPGDSSQVIAQKAANRKLAVQGFKNNAGKAAFSAPAAKPSSDGWSVTEVK